MKRLGLAALLVLGIAPVALADQIQIGYPGSSYGPYQTGIGGEFTANPINPVGWLDLSGYVSGKTKSIGVSGTFQTFCLEMNEHIGGYPSTYNAQLNQNAVYGGGGGGPLGDPVSVGTGWLYSQFAAGTLPGYDYGAGRLDSAAALQEAIWYLEEELTSYTPGNIFIGLVTSSSLFGSVAGAMTSGGWNYGVYALNLTDAAGNRFQDQLYHVPDGGMTLMLLGGALIGMSALRPKFRA